METHKVQAKLGLCVRNRLNDCMHEVVDIKEGVATLANKKTNRTLREYLRDGKLRSFLWEVEED